MIPAGEFILGDYAEAQRKAPTSVRQMPSGAVYRYDHPERGPMYGFVEATGRLAAVLARDAAGWTRVDCASGSLDHAPMSASPVQFALSAERTSLHV